MSDQPLSPPTYAPARTPAIEIPSYLRIHWALVLLGMIVAGIFIRGLSTIWLVVQAHWMRKTTGRSAAYTKALTAFILLMVTWVIGLFTGGVAAITANNNTNNSALGIGMLVVIVLLGIVNLVSWILYIVAAFALRRELEAAPFGMRLSGVMTFFFNSLYFQYHLQKWGLPGEVGGPPAVVAPPPAPAPPPTPGM